MSRLHTIPILMVLALAPGGAARAQMGGGGGVPLPIATDLKKVPVGSWAEYTMTIAALPGGPTKVRMALVGKDAKGFILENVVEGGMAAAMGGKMTIQITMGAEPTKGDALKKALLQIGDGDPMELPAGMAAGQSFEKPNAANLVGEEKITVGGTVYKTKHYRAKSPNGHTVDSWLSEEVPPFGLVKMEMTTPQGAMKQELVAKGKDAKPIITKPAKPFDPSKMMMGMGGGGGAAPAAPAPGSKPAAAPATAPAAAPKK